MTPPDVTAINRQFYDALWWKARLQRPDRFNTWPMVSALLPSAPSRLELGPGLRPRLPIAGTNFIDISTPVIEQLNARGGIATAGRLDVLPFSDRQFNLVCAFDVIEHIEDDRRLFREVSRVLEDEGVFIVSVPLHPGRWTGFDALVGHARRYEPSCLLAILADNRLIVEKSAAFGMQPANPRLVDYGMQWLERHRDWAMFWYNRVGLPLAMLFQKRLELENGFMDPTNVDEMVLLCRLNRRGIRCAWEG